uniref:Uncharacterized protein n=1 Tax=viral metagenome TaxID=1070528 RepID=A0A6C0JEJ0_9ZZZZ
MTKYNQKGRGYFSDLNENIAGRVAIGRYSDNNPPIFKGELTEGIQLGGNIIDKKIYHLERYIKNKGNYKLPKYILNDL